MFNSIFVGGSMTDGNILLSLGLAIVLGVICALYYTWKNAASRSFAFTLALLPLITATVIMAVNGNLGAGIAVAGSFSLIRFRSAQGSADEIAAILVAMGSGIAFGMGYIGYGVVILLCLAGLFLLLKDNAVKVL